MRYEYTVTKEGGEAEIMKAMSWKKLFKSLLLKYPKFSGWCTYINKRGHVQVRAFHKGREEKKPEDITQKEWVKGHKKWKGKAVTDYELGLPPTDEPTPIREDE